MCLSLPHPSTLRWLYSNIGLDTNFIDYLKVASQDFNKFKKHFLLQLDEIHVRSDYTYKGGNIFGSSFIKTDSTNPENNHSSESDLAKTVLAFQVTSLFTKWSEIVRLLPCCNAKSSDLLPIVKQVIIDIEKCDLRVIIICTDDYQLNVSLFKSLADNTSLQLTCPNQSDPTRSIFLMFDPVHIVKCIRNNWIYQKDINTTLTFPSIDHYFSGIFPYNLPNASFKDIYKSEQYSNAKIAHKLTSKVVWPSVLERQSVPLALAVWDQSTYNADSCIMKRIVFPTKPINSFLS